MQWFAQYLANRTHKYLMHRAKRKNSLSSQQKVISQPMEWQMMAKQYTKWATKRTDPSHCPSNRVNGPASTQWLFGFSEQVAAHAHTHTATHISPDCQLSSNPCVRWKYWLLAVHICGLEWWMYQWVTHIAHIAHIVRAILVQVKYKYKTPIASPTKS